MNFDECWLAILKRDRKFDCIFVYGVISTKIYCLPSCPSRKPKKENVRFFDNLKQAEKAGFRACKRCYRDRNYLEIKNIESIEKICQTIDIEIEKEPTLTRLANEVDLSPSYLQRKFKQILGITPRQYAEARRLQRFKNELKKGLTITDALYAAGYNSSSTLYEKTARQLGMTPKIYRQGGKKTQIIYTIVPCYLGYLLVATTDIGICAVKLGENPAELTTILLKEFDRATIVRDDNEYKNWLEKIIQFLAGKETDLNLPLDIKGTAFQKQVWQALQKIPYGETRTYTDIAKDIGNPKASRAVGNACATNPIALIVPCHRVLRQDGNLGGYRWGVDRKQKLLAQESTKSEEN